MMHNALFQALVQKMPDGEEGMAVNHPGPGVTHDLADSISHFRFVTMNGTICADWFSFAEAA
jgi:hypothetical protein